MFDLTIKLTSLSYHNSMRESSTLKYAHSLIMEKCKAYEDRVKAPKKASKKAHDGRYQERRELLKELAIVAGKLWKNGSTLLHHQMKDFLLNDYADQAGRLPFVSLPEKTVLKNLKDVARELQRPDLISGQKKSL